MIDEYIARNARRSPDSPALRTAKGELTFGQVDVVTEHLAMRLRERGVSRGARVALAAGNSLEFVVALFATLRLGAVAVPLNTRLAPAEVAYLLADSSPMMVVVSEQYAALISEAVSDAAVIELGLPDATGALVIDGEELAASCDFPFEDEPGRGQDDPALILYTSGTTGRPKGAVLSHLAIHVNSVSVLGRLGLFDPAEWRHVGVPLFHSGGVNSLFQQLILGAPAYIAETGGFDPAAVLDDLESNEIATAFFAPTQWQRICAVEDIATRRLALRRIVWGTSSTPLEVLETLHKTFTGLPVFAQFGQTETCGTACSLPPEYASSKIGSVGRPLSHIQMRIVDDEMRDVQPGATGEIVYRGPTLLTEYWNAPEATAEAFEGGWFHSGDLGRIDEDGFCYVVGRLKEMIISGGENIYPLEVEAAILTHPKVREVAVVGIPDERWVETPKAVIVPADAAEAPTLQEVQRHLVGRLASYKKPTVLEIRDVLPRNSIGKILKGELK